MKKNNMEENKRIRRKKRKSNKDFLEKIKREEYKLDEEKQAVLDVAYLRNFLLSAYTNLLENYYAIGEILVKNKNKPFYNRLLRIFALPETQVEFAIALYTDYNSKEDMILEFETKYNYRINYIYREKTKKYFMKKPTNTGISGGYKNLFKKIDVYDKLNENEQNILYLLYKEMKKIFPDKPRLDDKYYLKYSECAFCNSPAPPEGNELINHPQFPFIKIPLCNDCAEKGLYDPESLVKIYAYYAMNLENAINKIHNIDQEDDGG